ncbi:MAG: hypothetical protein H7A23_09385 [Leptospiraceae bacterium]|nr:hypothetical protein [Leptospiraceae bacterium]MCP5494756.1 hypothetical protein [Leptospiraceae bacterium]
MEILIETKDLPNHELKRKLENYLHSKYQFKEGAIIFLLTKEKATKGIDPNFLNVLLPITGTAVGFIIKGLLDILKEREKGKIILKGEFGTIEIPVNTSEDELNRYVQILERMKNPKITLL